MQLFAPHRRSGFIDVAVITIIVLVSAVVAVPVTYFANKTTTENRSYATISCGGGTCPDGWSYGADTAAPQASCPQRAAEACASHQLKPATAPPTSTAPPPTTGSCPNGQSKACGGCLVGVCVSIAKETCQAQINRLCNTNPTCAGNGVAPAAGQSCCSPYVLYSNGKCGTPTTASCIATGGSKPVGGTTPCCSGSYDCGTSCAESAAKCPAQPVGSAPVQIPAGSTCSSPSGCICTDTGKQITNGASCSSQLSLSPGVSCPNGNITCKCVRTGQTVNGGEKCPLLANGAACTTGSECTSTYCNGICQAAPTPAITPSPLPIAAGTTCSFAYGCVCKDTGRTMQNTWTCPAQVSVSPGATCPGGNSTCTCAKTGQTINGGDKCPLLANGAACTTGSECTSTYCSVTCQNIPGPKSIAPGATCDSTYGCTCSDSGRFMQNTWTCPAPLPIAAGQTCQSTSCTCPGSLTIRLEGYVCPKLANGMSCSSASNCQSGYCTTVCIARPVSCNIASVGIDIAGGQSICEKENGPSVTTCSSTGVVTKSNCPSGQTCQGTACKPNTLVTNPLATPIAIAGGEQCTGSVIDPGCLCATTGKVIFAPAICEKALLGPAQPTEGSKCSLPHGQYDSTFSMYCCTPSTGTQSVYSKSSCSGAQGYYIFGSDLVDGTWCTPGTLGGCTRCASKTTYTLNGQTYCGTAPQASNTVIISPGTTCTAATNCVCTDSGRLMPKTWTCPAQTVLQAGATCQAGNNTCICPDKKTIMSGEKCAVPPPAPSTAACATLSSVTCSSNPTCEWVNMACQIKGAMSTRLTSCTAICNTSSGCTCPTDQGCRYQSVMTKGGSCGGVVTIQKLGAGEMCVGDSSVVCHCLATISNVFAGTTCPKLNTGSECTVDGNCISNICNSQGRCDTVREPNMIAPGETCRIAFGCVCKDSGRMMQNTWTCPAQTVLQAGATCQAGINTCICPDKQTIISGASCAVPPSQLETIFTRIRSFLFPN